MSTRRGGNAERPNRRGGPRPAVHQAEEMAMTTRRTRNDDDDDPWGSLLEEKIDRIDAHVLQTRDEVSRLFRDVERLFQYSSHGPAEPHPGLRREVADLVVAEFQGQAFQDAVAKIIDGRFKRLREQVEQVQAKVKESRDPLQGLRLNSRGRR